MDVPTPRSTAMWAAMVLALASWSSSAEAQSTVTERATEPAPRAPFVPDTMETARGMALGLGARASATSTSAVAYNAAGLSIGRHYHIESVATYHPQAGRFSVGGSLSDSYSGPVNMGVNYRYVHGTSGQGYAGMDGRIAIGVPIGDSFAVGATGRYMSFWREGAEDNADPYAEHVTFDASIRVSPIEGLHIAALGYNLIDVGSSLAPLQVGGSISYTIDGTFTLAFDGLADLGTFDTETGDIRPEALFGGAVEYFTGEVPIRAGYYYDTGRDYHYVSAGAGWMNESLGIDVAWRQQVTGPMDTWILASFRYFVH